MKVTIGNEVIEAMDSETVAELERRAYDQKLTITYEQKRIVKFIHPMKFANVTDSELKELIATGGFRMALSATMQLNPDMPFYAVHDVVFVRLVGNYWAVVGYQTSWDESDEIKA